MRKEGLFKTFSERYRTVLIFGPPGAGKGTLGTYLSSAGNHFHLSSGDIFRGLSPESPAGKLYHQYAHKGNLVPDDVTIEIWNHYVEGLIATNRYFPESQLLLLDGIPRTLNQAKLIDKYIQVEHIVVLKAKDEMSLYERIKRRALIEKRQDDIDPEILKNRMEIYNQETTKVLSYYPTELQSNFDANKTRLEVLSDVLKELLSLLKN